MAKEVYRDEIESLVRQGALLIDVRESDEHEDGDGLPGHTHIPLSRISELAARIRDQRPMIFYCRSGLMSYQAAEIASAWTAEPTYYLSGGLLSCTDA
jgi:rhodanese-related sulfurtransferase